nr:S-layer homology domain-containing protein [Desulforamulus aquiferis]
MPADYWCAGDVGAAVKMGLAAGYSDGTFRLMNLSPGNKWLPC